MEKSKKEIIMIFTGGIDSLYSAVRFSELGYTVDLMIADNGHTEHMNYTLESAEYLANKIDSIYKCVSVDITVRMYDYLNDVMHTKNLGFETSQLICLCCRAAMIVESVIKCYKNDARYLAMPDESDSHCMFVQPAFIELFHELCRSHTITFMPSIDEYVPVRDRKIELAKRGIYPNVNRSQCWIGFKPENPSDEEINKAKDLFLCYILPKMERDINDVLSNYNI